MVIKTSYRIPYVSQMAAWLVLVTSPAIFDILRASFLRLSLALKAMYTLTRNDRWVGRHPQRIRYLTAERTQEIKIKHPVYYFHLGANHAIYLETDLRGMLDLIGATLNKLVNKIWPMSSWNEIRVTRRPDWFSFSA